MAAESSAAKTWVYTTLAADSTLATLVGSRIYLDVSEEGADYPLVMIYNDGGKDVRGVGTVRIFNHADIRVDVFYRTTSPASVTAGQGAANRVDQLLHGQAGSALGREITGAYREENYEYPDPTGGVYVMCIIQKYSVLVSGTPN
jgi:hypothetical protein